MQGSVGLTSQAQFKNDLWDISGLHSPLESPGGSLSKLDLKAPAKARREYEKGYQLLLRKDYLGSVDHLTTAISIYPSFVAAHNALGSAYLALARNDEARAEFARAVALDDHLPNSYLNLGCAQLALQQFDAAEQSIQKASAIAPLDLTLLTALAYGELMNHNYSGTVATARQVHDRKHAGAALVHFYAAAALEAQDNLTGSQQELQTFLREDPKSPAAAAALQIMRQITEEQQRPPVPALGLKISFTTVPDELPSRPVQLPEHVRQLMQDSRENSQIAEAEADSQGHPAACPGCAAIASAASPAMSIDPRGLKDAGLTFRASTDEVAVFFTATDHGKSVTNLTGRDIGILDDNRAPAAITGFRNESELPLRLGIVIDTSDSVGTRFSFEQNAASSFLQKVLTGRDDLAFVIGVANSVLLVQDFTADQKLLSHSVSQLVSSGGTALWDAVAYAADKLASHPESQPVSRILVVISDGEDNSSVATLAQSITRAQHGEVAVYAVSTREDLTGPVAATPAEALIGEHALKTLAELTGGAAFTPGSIHRLNGSLFDLQQVIRSRYLVSYKPALFNRDGHYRPIDITAKKDGHKLHVYARKGYFASSNRP
jgi:Ca-activated chloride channel homolog